MSLKGRKNLYTCEQCEQWLVTIDVDDGVTPFLLSCRVTKDCTGQMQSSFYKVILNTAPHMEWYKPKAAEAKRLPHGLREHVKNGGLILRPVDYS